MRDAGVDDAAFLVEMLAVAADWRPDRPVRAAADVLADQKLAAYVVGWPQAGEHGVVAEAEEPLGAAWVRAMRGPLRGYGYIDDETPELSIGVRESARGSGIGTALLEAVIDQAVQAGTRALSLSVETDNPAMRLYQRIGFVVVQVSEDAATMCLRVSG